MKQVIISTLLVLQGFLAFSQSPNFNEWLRQKKTQRRYLVEQIAALQVYLGYVKKGYNIVDKGLTTIGNIKGATRDLDNAYLGSLKQVSPVITNSPKFRETTTYYQLILRELRALSDDAREDVNFSSREKAYIEAVYEKMRTDCNSSMEASLLAVSPEMAEMQDAERLVRLNKVHAEMGDRLAFTKHFVSTTRALSMQRAKEKQSIELMKKLNGHD